MEYKTYISNLKDINENEAKNEADNFSLILSPEEIGINKNDLVIISK